MGSIGQSIERQHQRFKTRGRQHQQFGQSTSADISNHDIGNTIKKLDQLSEDVTSQNTVSEENATRRQIHIRHQPYNQGRPNDTSTTTLIPHNTKRIRYRSSMRNGIMFFRKDETIIQENYPDILTILPQLVEKLTRPYPGNWYGCSMQNGQVENINEVGHCEQSDQEELEKKYQKYIYDASFYEKESRFWIVPRHPFDFSGDSRPPLYSVQQFDISSSSVSLIEWPKVLVSPEAVLNGPYRAENCRVYPEGFTIEVEKRYPQFRPTNSAEHYNLVLKTLPEGFLVKIPPNSMVLSRGSHKEKPFMISVHKFLFQDHTLRLDSKKFDQAGLQQQYRNSDDVKIISDQSGTLECLPEVDCCDFPATEEQIEHCDKFSPFLLAQHMFPDGLLIKVDCKRLLYHENLIVVKPYDVTVPQGFVGGREGMVSVESIEGVDVLPKLLPHRMARAFFPNGLVLSFDKYVVGQFVTPINDSFSAYF